MIEGGGMTTTTTSSRHRSFSSSSSSSSVVVDDAALRYSSHALGGLFGGGVVGFLFQGKPLAGAVLFTPMMLIVGKIEGLLDEYRAERMGQLMSERNDAYSRDEKGASP
jgi:hypothetical protein